MNRNEHHDKEIEVIWSMDGDQGCTVRSGPETRLKMSVTYHGDRDEFWVVELALIDDKWREIARHNPRYLSGWMWKALEQSE